MPAQVFCEHCGGLVYSATGIPSLAKRCTCGQPQGSHPAEKTVITKVCRECGKDVTHQPRMKDSDGKYWCIACGEADHARKHQPAGNCADCHMRWPVDMLKSLDGLQLCEGCYQTRMQSRQNLERAFGRRKWWSVGIGVGLGAAALVGAVAWVIKVL
jgi:hypothetical protein